MATTIKKRLKKVKEPTISVKLTADEKATKKWLTERIPKLKETKKQILNGVNFEQIMREADREYQPRFLFERQTKGSIVLIQDEIKGVRGSRIVQLGQSTGQEWRSNLSEPTLMVKIQTAISILVDQNPDAVFKALSEKYKDTSVLAKALWKRNWKVSNAKLQLKLFVFDLAKYGWACGYTYPRLVRRKGQILEELDMENPEKNKYKEVTITEFNDVYREKLDPYRTWIDDMTNLTDPWSTRDWYFEKDFTIDDFKDDGEFAIYENAKFVKAGSKVLDDNSEDGDDGNQQTKERTDIVTVGFYENKEKDLYTIWIPEQKIPLYVSPLPNDDKRLSLWHTYWNERDPRTPYGIGLYEILKHNKLMFDRLENMSIDQLTMAIYPMIFYSGNKLPGSGDMSISPSTIKQKLPGTTIEQIKIDYDQRGFEGSQFMLDRIDENTGITPTLEGQITGKTLGEVLQAKDSALKRLSIPLENIAQALETDAYLTMSWMNQIYSVPEVIEFTDLNDLKRYEKETGKTALQVVDEGNELFQKEKINDVKGKFKADFFPVLDLPLANAGKDGKPIKEGEEDRQGNLIESPDDRFFRLGIDLDTSQVKWEGIITIKPSSILSPFPELERQRKMELFQIVMPIVQQMGALMTVGDIQGAVALFKPLKQIFEAQDEKPDQWIPDSILEAVEDPEKAQQKAQQNQPLFINPEQEVQGQQSQAVGPKPTNVLADITKSIKGGGTQGANQVINRTL